MKHLAVIGGEAESIIGFRGELIRSLCAEGYRVTALAGQAKPSQIKKINALGAEYIPYNIKWNGLDIISDIQTIRELKILMLKLKPDIILSYTVKPILFSSFVTLGDTKMKKYFMITGLGYGFMRDTLMQKILNAFIKILYKMALFRSNAIIFQNEEDENVFRKFRLIQETKRTIIINGSGVNLEYYRPYSLSNEPIFLLIARLLYSKGVYEYCEASRLIKREYPTARCILVGYIDENPTAIPNKKLQSWITDGVVEYYGQMDDVRSAIRESNIYVLPSYREGMARTILEAMAMGRPVITTDVPGCRETTIHGVNGFLIEKKNINSLVNAMKYFILNPHSIASMGAQSLKIVREKFDVKLINRILVSEISRG
jgi:glycosyltransferase involved in cell wall biosynthesis